MEPSRARNFTKLTGIYRWAEDSHFDAAYYASEHARLTVEALAPLGLVRFECDRMVNTEPPASGAVIAVSNAYFRSTAEAQTALAKAGPALAADLVNYTNLRPVMHLSEVSVFENEVMKS